MSSSTNFLLQLVATYAVIFGLGWLFSVSISEQISMMTVIAVGFLCVLDKLDATA